MKRDPRTAKQRVWPPRHRLSPQQIADMPTGLTPEEERRRYFHDVGIASQMRLHMELAADHERCPICDQELRP